MLQAGNVFANDVKLQVDNGADLDIAEVCMFESVGDDSHLESVLRGVAYRQTDAIDRDGTLVDGKVTMTRHLLVLFVFEGEIGAAIGILHSDAAGSLVDVSLNDMSVETSIHQHRPLDVHLIADLQQSEVRTIQSFLHSSDGIGTVFYTYYGEAYTVMSYALVNAQLVDKRAA